MTFDAHIEVLAIPLVLAGNALGIPGEVSIPVSLLLMSPASFPDLMAYPETRFGEWGNLYQKTHSYDWWKGSFFKPWTDTHIWIDKQVHDPKTGKWTWKAYLSQALTWGAMLWLIFNAWYGR